MWISNAGFAHVFIVFARIGEDKNITGFVCTKDMPGLVLGEEEPKLGLRSSSTRMVYFEDVKCPVENLLGERNGGFKIAMNALNVGRIKLGIATLESCRNITEDSVKFANERK